MGRSGKTALVNAITNKQFSETKSTIGMDLKVFKMVQACVGRDNIWVAQDTSEKETIKAAAYACLDASEKATAASESQATTTGPIVPSSAQNHVNKVRALVTSSASHTSPSSPAEFTPTATSKLAVDADQVKAFVEQSKGRGEGESRPAVVSFLDLGGQEVFYPLHSFFITSTGFFLIVFNMELLLPTASDEEKEEVLDYIRRWENAIVVRVPLHTFTYIHAYIFTNLYMIYTCLLFTCP